MKPSEIIDNIRKQFKAFTTAYVGFVKKAEFSTVFVQAYLDWRSAQGNSKESTRINFVRQIDPTVPEEREAYQTHKSWMSATYLFRVGTPRIMQAAKTAMESGNATPQQKTLLAESSKGRRGKGQPKGQKTEIKVSVLFRALAYLDVDPNELTDALANAGGVGDAEIAAIVKQYKAAITALRKAA